MNSFFPSFCLRYGPEEYMIKTAMPGKYLIQAKYFSNSRQDMSGATSLLLTLSTGWGRPEEVNRLTALRLAKNKSIVDVGEIHIPKKKKKEEDKEDKISLRVETGKQVEL